MEIFSLTSFFFKNPRSLFLCLSFILVSPGTEEIEGTGKKLYRTFVSQDSCDFYKVYQELYDCIRNFVYQDLCDFYKFPSKTVIYQELYDCNRNLSMEIYVISTNFPLYQLSIKNYVTVTNIFLSRFMWFTIKLCQLSMKNYVTVSDIFLSRFVICTKFTNVPVIYLKLCDYDSFWLLFLIDFCSCSLF